MALKIGVDFGGVLSIHDQGERAGAEHNNTTINIPEALESLRLLKQAGHKLYLNSFCGKNRAMETKAAIEKEAPGLFDGLFFVKNKKFKGAITRYLGCDAMIDDRLDILQDIQGCKPIWFKGDPTFEDTNKLPRRTNIVEAFTWKEAVEICMNLKPTAIADPTVEIVPFLHMV
jgi:hypothetical protein